MSPKRRKKYENNAIYMFVYIITKLMPTKNRSANFGLTLCFFDLGDGVYAYIYHCDPNSKWSIVLEKSMTW